MQQVTLEQFETAVKSHPNDEDLDVVFFTNPGCHTCETVLNNLEGISVDGINFYHVELEGFPPLFAITSLPSMTIFHKGHKLTEMLVSQTIQKKTLESVLINITEGAFPGPGMI